MNALDEKFFEDLWSDEAQALLKDHPELARAVDGEGKTALHWMADEGGDAGFARALLEAGADVDAEDANEDTPLHIALRGDNADVADLLLDRGADVSAWNRRRESPFLAGFADFRECDGNLRGVLYSVYPRLAPLVSNVDETTKDGDTLLHVIVEHGTHGERLPLLRALMKEGADPYQENTYGYSPLHLAIGYNDVESVKVLLAGRNRSKDIAGALFFLLGEDLESGFTPEMLRELCRRGLLLSAKNEQGDSLQALVLDAWERSERKAKAAAGKK